MDAYRVLRPLGAAPLLLICDHASNRVPAELQSLGLAEAALASHIGWDIGAAGVTETLSEMLDAPAVLSAASRLVIDCNRQLSAPDLIPVVSHQTIIPGNRSLSREAREDRIEQWFRPYHNAIEELLIDRKSRQMPVTLISIHSMTPSLSGMDRPWKIALSSHIDRGLTDVVLAELRRLGDMEVGDNQPYDLDPACDYSVPQHALRRKLPYLQVEFRQDLIATPAMQADWARRFACALPPEVRRSR